jgi:hypothetical protein
VNVDTGEFTALTEQAAALTRKVDVLGKLVTCLYDYATERPARQQPDADVTPPPVLRLVRGRN